MAVYIVLPFRLIMTLMISHSLPFLFFRKTCLCAFSKNSVPKRYFLLREQITMLLRGNVKYKRTLKDRGT